MKYFLIIISFLLLGVTRPPQHHTVDIVKSAQYQAPAQTLPDLDGLVKVARGWEAIRRETDSLKSENKYALQ